MKQRNKAFPNVPSLCASILLGCTLAVACVQASASEGTEGKAQQLKQQHLKSVGSRAHKQFYSPTQWNLSDLPAYEPKRKVSGTIRIGKAKYLRTGSVMQQWEEEFGKLHPEVRFEHSEHDLQSGLVDLVQQRGFTWSEWQDAMLANGTYPLEVEMATGSYNVPGWTPAFAIFVNKDNPIKGLTIEQLDGIFGGPRQGGWERTVWNEKAARGRDKNIRSWGQLGLTGEWAAQEITPHGRPLKYHIQLYFERKVFQGGSIWNENLKEYPHILRPDGTRALSSVSMVEAVANDRYGIAFADLASNIPAVKYLPIARKAGEPYVELTLDNLRSRKYPLFLEVYLYVNRAADKPLEPAVDEFLRYALSRQGQQAIQTDAKWLPLTAPMVKQQLQKL